MDVLKTAKGQDNPKETHQIINYKMVTFSLCGKDYGIDIMKVKEISKVEKFTYVPNTFPFVLGVHNLRGDIISIIDMRRMFGLPPQEKQDVLNVIIIRLKEFQLGIVVDSINKVIGINSETIQPPPPLLGDINIKYLNGVVEDNDNLFLILDVDKIFEVDETKEFQEPKLTPPPAPTGRQTQKEKVSDHEFSFITETLATFKKFHVTPLNRGWVEQRFAEWKALRASQNEDFQLKNTTDAEAYLNGFFSQNTNQFIDDNLKTKLQDLLPGDWSGTINAWNSGCGRGYEAYSLGVILKEQYPKEILKIWANDNDLLSVSTAPNLIFKEIELPDYIRENQFLEKGPNGLQFKKELKDLIYFEFHDSLNTNAMPDIDLIISRDVLSFQTPGNQKKMLDEFDDKLKAGGLLIIGDNEELDEAGWTKLDINGVSIYRKEK